MTRAVLIGTGGFGGAWVRNFLPYFRDRLDIVGIADIDPGARDRAANALGVAADHTFASYTDLLNAVEADVAFVVIPPAARTEVVRAAASKGLHILCEKPVAASWEQTLEIGRIARDAGIRFAIMQNYREQSRIKALKSVLQRPELREINLIESRFAVNYTIDTAGGAFRHQIPDAFIYEGAEHHLDQLRNLTDSDADWVQGHQWGQPWSTFGGSTSLSLIIRMLSGVVIHYEMNHVERGHQNGWHSEYYRINTSGGTVVLDADDVIRIVRDTVDGEVVEEVIPGSNAHDEHYVLIGQFLDWVEGGSPPFNVFSDNVRTMALTFAAVEATHTGQRVSAQDLLATAGSLADPSPAS